MSLGSEYPSYGFYSPFVSSLNPAPANISVEVTAQAISGKDFDYGIGCRSDDTGATDYEFTVTSGSASINKYADNAVATLAYSNTNAVKAHGENHLRVSCNSVSGHDWVHLLFWINGIKAYDVIDRSNPLNPGRIGLVMERTARSHSKAKVDFDNFIATHG
jgi:hypothetical protein